MEFLVKTSELLGLKGIPVKEKNEKVSELLQLHQHIRDKIREYETVLSMASKFHQLYQEVKKTFLSEHFIELEKSEIVMDLKSELICTVNRWINSFFIIDIFTVLE